MSDVDLSQPVDTGSKDGKWIKRTQLVVAVLVGAAFLVRLIMMQRTDHQAMSVVMAQGATEFQHFMKRLTAKNAAELCAATTKAVQEKHTEAAWEVMLRKHPELSGKWEMQGSEYSSRGAGFWSRFFGLASHDHLARHSVWLKLPTPGLVGRWGEPSGQILKIELVNEGSRMKVQHVWLGQEQLVGP